MPSFRAGKDAHLTIKLRGTEFVLSRFQKTTDAKGIVSLLVKSFETFRQSMLTPKKWLNFARVDSGVKNKYSFIAKVKKSGRIVSHVQILIRESKISDGSFLKIAGIANVCTDPNFRRIGLSAKLLKYAHDQILKDENEIPVSALFASYTSEAHSIYRNLGFRDVRVYETKYALDFDGMKEVLSEDHLTLSTKRLMKSRHVTVRSFDSIRGEGVRATYDRWLRRHSGLILRNREYWRSKYFANNSRQAFFEEPFDRRKFLLVIDDEIEKVLGYLAFNTLPDGTCLVRELVTLRERDALIVDLLIIEAIRRALVLRCHSISLRSSSAVYFPHSLLERSFRRFVNEHTYMVSVLDLERLVKLLFAKHMIAIREMIANNRGKIALSGGDRNDSRSQSRSVVLDCGYGLIKLSEDEEAQVVPRKEPIEPDLEISEDNFVSMILGAETASEIRDRGGFVIRTRMGGDLSSCLEEIFRINGWTMCAGDQW